MDRDRGTPRLQPTLIAIGSTDLTAKKTNEFSWCMRIFVPRRSRSLSALLVLTVPFFTCRSNHAPPPIPYSVTLLVFSVAASPPLYKLASFLAPHRIANTVSLANDIEHDNVDRPSGIVVPRTHTPSSLRASIFHRLAYTPAFRTRPMALAIAGASLYPSSL